jgi:hypothetical protein
LGRIVFKCWAWLSIYKITAILKIETDIITSIEASPIGRPGILVIMYVEIFEIDVFVFISIKRHNHYDNATSH